jgi:hypothetical protein
VSQPTCVFASLALLPLCPSLVSLRSWLNNCSAQTSGEQQYVDNELYEYDADVPHLDLCWYVNIISYGSWITLSFPPSVYAN